MSEQLWAALRIKPALTESEPTPKWVSEHTRSGRIPMLWSGDPKDHGFNGPVVPVTLIETAELDALRADAERLDWLDTLNRVLNGRYGTSYGWRLVTNHNVNRLFLGHLEVDLHDSEGGAQKLPSCRAAIDAHRQTLCATLKGGEE